MASSKLQTGNLQSSWSRFCGLTWGERWLLLQAFAFLLVIGAGLQFMNFQRLRSILLRSAPVSTNLPADAALQQAAALSRLVQAAAGRMPWTITCLVRSTTLWYLLRRQGLDSEIRIGVNQQGGEFHAHAWVEYAGIVLNDRHDIHLHFVPFEQITMPGSTKKV